MSWENLMPVKNTLRPQKSSPFMIKVSRVNKWSPFTLSIVAIPGLLTPDVAQWWVADQHVEALLGRSDHAGLIRLTKNDQGVFVLRHGGGRTSSKVGIFLPLPEHVKKEERKLEKLTSVESGDSILITLPLWGRDAPQVTTVPNNPVPFRMGSIAR